MNRGKKYCNHSSQPIIELETELITIFKDFSLCSRVPCQYQKYNTPSKRIITAIEKLDKNMVIKC